MSHTSAGAADTATMDVPCPTCKAGAGSPCVDISMERQRFSRPDGLLHWNRVPARIVALQPKPLPGSVTEARWIRTRPTMQRRCALRGFDFLPTVSDLTPKQAWFAFQTIRRWYARGHDAQVRALAAAWKAAVRSGSGIGSIESFRFIQSPTLQGVDVTIPPDFYGTDYPRR